MMRRIHRFTNLNNFLGRRLIFYIMTYPHKPYFYRWLDSVLKNEDFSLPALYSLYCILLKYDFTLDKLKEHLLDGVAAKYIKLDESRYFFILCQSYYKLMKNYETSCSCI